MRPIKIARAPSTAFAAIGRDLTSSSASLFSVYIFFALFTHSLIWSSCNLNKAGPHGSFEAKVKQRQEREEQPQCEWKIQGELLEKWLFILGLNPLRFFPPSKTPTACDSVIAAKHQVPFVSKSQPRRFSVDGDKTASSRFNCPPMIKTCTSYTVGVFLFDLHTVYVIYCSFASAC